ncbi:minor capsid protein [Megamonas funiformis]|jgi:SPP1 gp7 family putative phage head morphogenesis protein|uniref:minor capsid protein n=1 Tax=Megamonas funiformis TaxID=437897 RepID=UPI0035219945
MDSESYWIKRAEEREQEWNKKSKGTIERELANYYKQALLRIEDDIAVLYGRFAKDNKLTYAEASKMLTSNEFKQWQMSMEDYLNTITDSKDNKLLLELNTLVMRKRISRLDKLYGDTLKNLYKLGTETEKSITEFLTGAYKDNYYKNLFDIGKSISIKSSAIEVDDKKVSKVLNSSWSGKNYSERIWKNTDNLAKLIKHEITDGFHRGVSINKMAKLVQQRMNVGKYEATRLVRTEMNYVQNKAALDSIKDSDMKYYIFLATLDKKTSTVCRAHDRKVYPVDGATPGTNMPPLHPHCRSTIAGNLTDYDTGRGKRTAKNKDGKRIIIPATMNYDDYYKVYIEKSMSFSQWEKAHKKLTVNANKPTLKELIKNTDIKSCTKDDIINIGRNVCEQFDIKNKIGDKKALKEVFSNFREMGGKLSSEQWAKGSNKITKQQLSEAFSYYPKDWVNYLTDSGKKLYTLITNRGFFNEGAVMANGKYYATKFPDYKTGYVSIHMNGMRKTTPYHEIGHYVEYFNKNALRISKEFLKARTKNEKPIKLKNLFPNVDYDNKETTKPDNFISPYIGKEYTDASEVLSMGLQAIFEPTEIIKKIEFIDNNYKKIYATIEDDIEFLHLIVGLILKA